MTVTVVIDSHNVFLPCTALQAAPLLGFVKSVQTVTEKRQVSLFFHAHATHPIYQFDASFLAGEFIFVS